MRRQLLLGLGTIAGSLIPASSLLAEGIILIVILHALSVITVFCLVEGDKVGKKNVSSFVCFMMKMLVKL